MGIAKSLKLTARVRQARLIYAFFGEIKESIRFLGAETQEIVNGLLKKDEYRDLKDGFMGLYKEEKRICETAMSKLGKTDTFGQLEYLSSVLKNIDMVIEKAERERQEKAKLYLTLGLCSGAMATKNII